MVLRAGQEREVEEKTIETVVNVVRLKWLEAEGESGLRKLV